MTEATAIELKPNRLNQPYDLWQEPQSVMHSMTYVTRPIRRSG
jgi:hypothetical protein